MTRAITLHEVSEYYPKQPSPAVDRFSLDIAPGEFLVLLGPSGCGKSTVLRMIAGLEDITTGELLLDGEYSNDLAPGDRRMAMVFQNFALYPSMTSRENIGFPLRFETPGAEPGPRVDETARILGIEEILDRYPGQLSGGERQRVAMGRAISRRPSVFLMDEPTTFVGISVDGPRAMHDAYRVDKGGKPTFDRVMRGLEVLRRHEVDWNVLTTIHAVNGDHGRGVYAFLRDELGARFIQFIPIIERATEQSLPIADAGWGGGVKGRPLYTQEGNLVTHRSVGPEQYGRFMIDAFEEWVRRDIGTVYVQMFDTALANFYGEPGGMCVHAKTCGLQLAIEHNGDLYSCDHYVEPGYLLGNIGDRHLLELVSSPRSASSGRTSSTR